MREILALMILQSVKFGYSVKDVFSTTGINIYDKRMFIELIDELRKNGLSSGELLEIIKEIYL